MPRRSLNASKKAGEVDKPVVDPPVDVEEEPIETRASDEQQTNAHDKEEEEKVDVKEEGPTRRTRRSLLTKKNKTPLSSVVKMIDSTSASDASESEPELKVETKQSSSKIVACLGRKRRLR